MLVPNLTIGLDLGDKVSRVCEVNAAGQVVKRASVGTTPTLIDAYFGERERSRVILEVGTHSPWISRRIEALGHEVVVSNPSAATGSGAGRSATTTWTRSSSHVREERIPRSCIPSATADRRCRRTWG
jgi:hypothetical protein